MYIVTPVTRSLQAQYGATVRSTKFHVHLEDNYSAQWGGYWFWRLTDAREKRDSLNTTLKAGI